MTNLDRWKPLAQNVMSELALAHTAAYAAYANHQAIQGKVAMTWHTWKRTLKESGELDTIGPDPQRLVVIATALAGAHQVGCDEWQFKPGAFRHLEVSSAITEAAFVMGEMMDRIHRMAIELDKVPCQPRIEFWTRQAEDVRDHWLKHNFAALSDDGAHDDPTTKS